MTSNPLTDKERVDRFNQELMEFLQATLETGSKELAGLWNQLTITYWLIVVISVLTFLAGILLVSTPVIVAWKLGQELNWSHLSAPGFGIADLAVLFLFRPVERMQGLMGDMGQIKLVIYSFQDQVALRLLETNLSERGTMGKAAEDINKAAKDSVALIERYFAMKKQQSRRGKMASEEPQQIPPDRNAT